MDQLRLVKMGEDAVARDGTIVKAVRAGAGDAWTSFGGASRGPPPAARALSERTYLTPPRRLLTCFQAEVTGPPLKGRKLVVLGDTSDATNLAGGGDSPPRICIDSILLISFRVFSSSPFLRVAQARPAIATSSSTSPPPTTTDAATPRNVAIPRRRSRRRWRCGATPVG